MDLGWVGFYMQLISALLLFGWGLPALVTYWLCKRQNSRPPTLGRCSVNAIACFLLEMSIGMVWGQLSLGGYGILVGLLISVVAGAVVCRKIMSISFLRAIPLSLICLVDLIAIGFWFSSQLVSLLRS